MIMGEPASAPATPDGTGTQLPIAAEPDVGISLSVLFTGYFNGFGVEVKSTGEMSLLYKMGCFGKGSGSRSKPGALSDDGTFQIMRRRQFQKRVFWANKFEQTSQPSVREAALKEDIADLMKKIEESPGCKPNRDVIELLSSDEEMQDASDQEQEPEHFPVPNDIDSANLAIVVPNSDSENENYFENLKPKCCWNRAKIDECLILSLQEAFFLAYGLGCLQILDYDKNPLTLEESWNLFIKTDERFVTKYIVYHYLRAKGYVVKSGLKFGGDYLMYKDGPGHSHADYIVVIKYSENQSDWLPITGHIRMAGTTSKEILLVEVIPGIERSHQGIISPEDISKYSVQESILHRKNFCNKDDDYEP